VYVDWWLNTRANLAEYRVLVVQLWRCSQREKELAPVVMSSSVRHCHKTAADKTQARMKFILSTNTDMKLQTAHQ